jgi:hypothetical protein
MSREILQHLNALRQRLGEQDPTLTAVCLWPANLHMSQSYVSMCLEETPVQEALRDCLCACAKNPLIESIRLGDLPEPDLEGALLTLARIWHGRPPLRLRTFTLGPVHASSSLAGPAVTKLCQALRQAPRLEVLDFPCRIRLANQTALQALATSLAPLRSLRRLRLHVIPRTSIEQPRMTLNPLLEVLAGLEHLEITAGFPQHNPYQQPLVSPSRLASLLAHNPTLRFLRLENVGLRGSHIDLMVQALPLPLEDLLLPHNPRLRTESDLASLTRHLALGNTRLARVEPRGILGVELWTTLNRLDRARLVRAVDGSAAHVRAWRDVMLQVAALPAADCLALNLVYTLIQKSPTVALQSLQACAST